MIPGRPGDVSDEQALWRSLATRALAASQAARREAAQIDRLPGVADPLTRAARAAALLADLLAREPAEEPLREPHLSEDVP